MRALFSLMMILISVSSMALESEFLPVEDAFRYQYVIEDDTLLVSWEIADGYYLYQDRIKATQGDVVLTPQFQQKAELKNDEFFGDTLVFHHRLDAAITLVDQQTVVLSFQGCAEAGLCYPPVKKQIELTKTPTNDKANTDLGDISALLAGNSITWQLLVFFLLGLGLAFTPCVFPMIPILSSIIVGQGDSITTRKAFVMSLTYVLAMALSYALVGTAMGYFGAQANIQMYLQTPWVIISFAAVFVLLSLSMFGFYELALPRFIQDRLAGVQSSQNGGNLLGVAIMGVLSALVVSPCVSAPLAGTLVYISTTGDALLGGFALFALGLGMGVPLLIIGTGGGRYMPKSGVWMNTVKNIFGVALIAIAIWLLGRIVSDVTSLMLWGVFALFIAVFLGAFDSPQSQKDKIKRSVALTIFLYALALFIGALMGNSDLLQPLKINNTSHSEISLPNTSIYKTADVTQIENEIAQAQGKSQWILIDVYADWCASCKIMDRDIFKHPDMQPWLEKIKLVKLDITDNEDEHRAFLDKHGIYGPPAILFFNKQGPQPNLHIVGEISRTEFFQHLENDL
ncbi:protein-disulfide reductase DsbD [Bermanella sp. R86510]|uniref:protein-disulfide reductase DsbD n=1 Tax=unclassified Bermanella TaxID=2627862 RepID=UPI0037C6295C